jgi:hypothetical protein
MAAAAGDKPALLLCCQRSFLLCCLASSRFEIRHSAWCLLLNTPVD